MALIRALDYAVLYVADLEAALAYFTERLGFARVLEQDGPGFRYLTGGAGGIDFGLLQASEHTPAPGTVELFFKTSDIAGLRAELTARDVEATPIEHRPFGSIFTIHAPDGQILTMMEPPAE
jgi:catechol 2,3-dioxygenase-like lactoylglutathione lyase family enzyme